MSSAELRREAKRKIERLSPERLRVAADFLSYLEECESNDATEELLHIPGFRDALAKAEESIKTRRPTNWRKVRRDV